jgi:hypothetical protein
MPAPPPAPDRPRTANRTLRRLGAAAVAVVVIGSGVAIVAARRRSPGTGAVPQSFQGRDVRAPDGVRVTVEVFNATRRRGLGRRATLYLRDQGFDVVTLGTVLAMRDTTVVIARTAHPDWARLVTRALGDARLEIRPDSSRDVDISVYIGASWRPPTEPFYP